MKIAKIILLALTTCLTSCYEDYTHDYETTNVGFALQNPLRTVISDRDMPIYVGVSLVMPQKADDPRPYRQRADAVRCLRIACAY